MRHQRGHLAAELQEESLLVEEAIGKVKAASSAYLAVVAMVVAVEGQGQLLAVRAGYLDHLMEAAETGWPLKVAAMKPGEAR